MFFVVYADVDRGGACSMPWMVRQPSPGHSWRAPNDDEIAAIMSDAEAALLARLPGVVSLHATPYTAREVAARGCLNCCVGIVTAELASGQTLHWRVWADVTTGERRLRRERESSDDASFAKSTSSRPRPVAPTPAGGEPIFSTPVGESRRPKPPHW
jgi:hypothetical protein